MPNGRKPSLRSWARQRRRVFTQEEKLRIFISLVLQRAGYPPAIAARIAALAVPNGNTAQSAIEL